MRIMYQFMCSQCQERKEVLQKRDDPAPKCNHGHDMQKEFTTPAFTFTNGKGTSGGHTWRIAGRKK